MAKMYQPTVVVGLGGTGKNIILALKKMIAENSRNGMADYPFLQLLSVDTDVSVSRGKSAIETLSESELSLDKEKETFSLKVDFNVIPNLKRDFQNIASWFPESLRPMLNPSELERGAGQKKSIGRFTFAWNAQNLYTRLQNILANPVPVGVANARAVGDNLSGFTNVFICGSVCGGTGAGTFIDTAYLIRYIASTMTRPVYVYGMLALSSLFEGIQGDAQIKPNCYASMLELDHFMNPINNQNPYRIFLPAYKNFSMDYSNATNKGPFDFPFLFDKTNSCGFSFDNPEQLGEMVARFIYLLTGHEVADSWQSMDNNVRKTLDVEYASEKFNKPNNYRAMGSYSIMFPRRMVIQLCAYRLAKDYFAFMLDDSYNPQEISNKAEYFLNRIKMNPAPEYGQLEKLFNIYREGEISVDFSDYVESQKGEMLEDEIDKKEIVSRVRQWKEDMETCLSNFKKQNSVTARNVRERFLSELSKFISEEVDLKTVKDEANRTPSGEPRVVRGSLLRTEKILEDIIKNYNETVDKYRKKIDACEVNVQDKKDNFETAVDELEKVAESVFSNKKKMSEALETVLDECVDYLNEKRLNLIYGWIGQLLTGILENNVQTYPGIIAELESRQHNLKDGVSKFDNLNEKVEKTLNDRKFFSEHSLCDILFDYDADVEGTYASVLEKRTKEEVFTTVSAKLKSNFGNSFDNLSKLSSSSILIFILKATEDFFFESVEKISIADKIIGDKKSCERLVNGNYYKNAERYLGLDGGQLDIVNINLERTTFSAITIPNEYTGYYCENLKGVLNTNAGKAKCPVDANPEEYRDKPCPKYGKCLKKLIIDSANGNLAVIPTDETSEVNVVKTIAGFPLHAVSTLIYNCKPIYIEMKKKFDNFNDSEQIHMFGSLKFIDLTERTEKAESFVNAFKENLFIALCVGRVIIQKASVDYITQNDLSLGNRDKPSLHLGTTLEDVYQRAQSTKAEDLEMVKLIDEEMSKLKERVLADESIKIEFAERIKKSFDNLRINIPTGMSTADFEMINRISEEICGQTLINKQKKEILW